MPEYINNSGTVKMVKSSNGLRQVKPGATINVSEDIAQKYGLTPAGSAPQLLTEQPVAIAQPVIEESKEEKPKRKWGRKKKAKKDDD